MQKETIQEFFATAAFFAPLMWWIITGVLE